MRPGRENTFWSIRPAATFKPLLEPLARLDRPVIVYGYGTETEHRKGNLLFKPYSDAGIFGGPGGVRVRRGQRRAHNLICEALYFGKPVLCFPIARLFEQFINAWHVRALGYGDFCTEPRPGREVFDRFEARLTEYRAGGRGGGEFRRDGAGGGAGARGDSRAGGGEVALQIGFQPAKPAHRGVSWPVSIRIKGIVGARAAEPSTSHFSY